MTGEFLVVFATASNVDEAERIAQAIVDESLAACVNIVPGCRSVYRWEGKTVKDEEALLIVKTSRARFDELARRVVELHTYDVPEVLGVSADRIADGYLRFLSENLGG